MVAENCDERPAEALAVVAFAGIRHLLGDVTVDGEKLVEVGYGRAVAGAHGGTAAELRQAVLGCQVARVGGLVYRLALDVPWGAAAEDNDAESSGFPCHFGLVDTAIGDPLMC